MIECTCCSLEQSYLGMVNRNMSTCIDYVTFLFAVVNMHSFCYIG